MALAKYDAMLSAIAECARVDEVKDIRDKAVALEVYHRQARNFEAEREAANVRLRAERRVGELLKELAKGQGNRNDLTFTDDAKKSPYLEALETNGMSYQTANRYQALADVPQETFDQALNGPDKPTANGILRSVGDPAPKVSDRALWLWGRLRDFENQGYFDADRQALFADMTDAMRADVLRLAPLVADFLTSLESTHEPA